MTFRCHFAAKLGTVRCRWLPVRVEVGGSGDQEQKTGAYLDDAILAAVKVCSFVSAEENRWLKKKKRGKETRTERGKRRNVKGLPGVVKRKEGPHAPAVLCYLVTSCWCNLSLGSGVSFDNTEGVTGSKTTVVERICAGTSTSTVVSPTLPLGVGSPKSKICFSAMFGWVAPTFPCKRAD